MTAPDRALSLRLLKGLVLLRPQGHIDIHEKYEKRAREVSSLLSDFTISAHIFRHSKAIYLYQAGIDLIYIRDILRHVDIATTEVYARVDTERKRYAVEKAYPEITVSTLADWNDDEDLIRKLSRLV